MEISILLVNFLDSYTILYTFNTVTLVIVKKKNTQYGNTLQ